MRSSPTAVAVVGFSTTAGPWTRKGQSLGMPVCSVRASTPPQGPVFLALPLDVLPDRGGIEAAAEHDAAPGVERRDREDVEPEGVEER